ncbi:chromosome partitioning protein ParA [Candidatus Termititenax spirochaetophilus]|uniref:Chromosome partitioning protein ParA n=1 Tax=Candidatus Termititenax spirochaetophilus TaxID=2218522 RepID=A0A388T8M6_9BACT|nr:chromosome partitioning protein ParA [Candidatus Termititenax spirochaetophilus]
MGKIIAIVNQKGGVGKTTTSINLGTALAESGKIVLLVDVDPQANTTSGVGVDTEKLSTSLYDLYTGQRNIMEVLYPTAIFNMHLLPGSTDLSGIELELMHEEDRQSRLKKILAEVQAAYDFILIDCPPALGLLTVNSLVAASRVIVPVQCEYFALEGLSRLTTTLELVKQNINPGLDVEGIVMTMYDARTTLSKEVCKEVRLSFGEKVFKTNIPRDVRISEAPSYGQPVAVYARRSKGAEAYNNLAKELIARGGK